MNLGIELLGVHLPSHQTHLPLPFVCRTPSPRICPVPFQRPVGGSDERATGIWAGITVHMSSPVTADGRSVRVPLPAPVVPASVTALELTGWFYFLRWWRRRWIGQRGGLWMYNTGHGEGKKSVHRCVWVPSNSFRSRFIRQIGWRSRALRADWRGIKLDPQLAIFNFEARAYSRRISSFRSIPMMT